MSDARLDLEVTIDGVEYVAKGLDDVASKSKTVGTTAAAAAPQSRTLSGALTGLSSGAMAANHAQNALAQLMAGNVVGAFKSATAACKALWTAMMSNPLTAFLAGATAAASALYVLYQRHVKAAEAAKAQADAQRQLNDEIAGIGGKDQNSVKQAMAEEAAKRGDLEWLTKMRDKYREVAAYKENLARGGIIDAAEYQAAIDSLGIYQSAIDGIAAATEMAAAAEQAASIQALSDYDEQISKAKELAWAQERDDEAALAAAQKEIALERELYGVKDEMQRLLIRRRQLLREMEQLNPDEGAGTDKQRLLVENEIWKIDKDILRIKDDAKTVTETEAKNRKTAAGDLKTAEENVTAQKQAQLTLAEKTAARMAAMAAGTLGADGLAGGVGDAGLGSRAAARMAAFLAGMMGEWKEFLPGGKYGPPVGGNGKGGGGGNGGGGNGGLGGDEPVGKDPVELVLGRIELELKGVRKDLTGGGA